MTENGTNHTPGILVNRVNYRVNEKKFDSKYTVLHAEYETYDMRKSAVNILSGFRSVRSIRYEKKRGAFYFMVEGNCELDEIEKKLNRIVLDEPIDRLNCGKVPRDILLDLLLNGLSYNRTDVEEDGENLTYSNLDGALFTFEPDDVHEDRIVTLNIQSRPAKDCVDIFGDTKLLFPAESFAAVFKLNDNEFDKKALIGLPRYQAVDDRYMKISAGFEFGSGGKEYVRRGYTGMKKASIDFFDVSSIKKLDQSKMGRVRLTLRKLRREYDDIGLEIDFVRTELFDSNKWFKRNTGFEQYLKTIWRGKKIHIIDKVNSETSRCIAEGVYIDMKKEFDVDIVESEDVVKGEYNIVIVRKNNRDPDHKPYSDAMVQHISVQNFATTYFRKDSKKLEELFEKLRTQPIDNSRKSSMVVLLSDLIIKGDVINGTQSYFGWFKERIMDTEPFAELDRTWYFYDRVRIENKDPEHRMDAAYSDQMGCLELREDGTMSFRLITEDEIKEDFQLQLVWGQFNKDNTNLRAVISDRTNTYAFLSTDVSMIPEVDMARDKLKQNRKEHETDESKPLSGGIRTRDMYEFYLKACTDIRYAYVKNECYYFVGVKGDNIDSALHWSANLFRVKTLEGKERLPLVMFDMMLAPFVRLNRYTITPYPFKYLREFEKTRGLENYTPEDPSERNSGKELPKEQWCLDQFGLM